MKTLLSLLALVATVTTAPAVDQKAKAIAVAKAACACEEKPVNTKADAVKKAAVACSATDPCKCRSGGECTCTQCKCVDAKETLPAPVAVVTESARFVLVTSPTCEPCHRMLANEVPKLRGVIEVIEVIESNGGYGATSFPTIIYEVNGKEKWRTTGYTSAGTLLSLRGS